MAIRGFELGTETDRMFANAEQKRAEREVGKTQFQEVVDASGTKPMTAEEFAYAGASMAPVTGDIIAYKEAPEDFERAYELMRKGYKEKDLVNLGLGTAFAGLVALGLIPGVGFVSRMGKNAAKDTVKDLIEEGNLKEAADIMVKSSKTFQDKALVNKQSEAQLKKLAEARIKFKNMSYREKKKALKRLNRPENITLYHGSKGMQDVLEGTNMKRKESLTTEGFQPFEGAGVFRERTETKLGFPKGTNRRPFTKARGLMSNETTGFHGEIEGTKLLSMSRDPNVSMSPSFTNPETYPNVPDDIPLLENIISAEIPFKSMRNMTPTAYDELVRGLANDKSAQEFLQKKYFGDKPDKYGASLLPKSGHLEAELAVAFPEYFNPKPILDGDPSKKSYNMGETLLLNEKTGEYDNAAMITEIRDIGKMTTPEKVQAAGMAYKKADTYFERIADIEDTIKLINTFPGQKGTKKAQKQAYDNIKNTLTSMADLAKYTSEYGARGSYDKILQRLPTYAVDFNKFAETFPVGSEKRANLKLLSTLVNTGFYGDAPAMNVIRKGFTPKKAVDGVLAEIKKGDDLGNSGVMDKAYIRHYLQTDSKVTTKKGATNKMIASKQSENTNINPYKDDDIMNLKKITRNITPREAKEMFLELTNRFNRGGFVKQKGLMTRS